MSHVHIINAVIAIRIELFIAGKGIDWPPYAANRDLGIFCCSISFACTPRRLPVNSSHESEISVAGVAIVVVVLCKATSISRDGQFNNSISLSSILCGYCCLSPEIQIANFVGISTELWIAGAAFPFPAAAVLGILSCAVIYWSALNFGFSSLRTCYCELKFVSVACSTTVVLVASWTWSKSSCTVCRLTVLCGCHALCAGSIVEQNLSWWTLQALNYVTLGQRGSSGLYCWSPKGPVVIFIRSVIGCVSGWVTAAWCILEAASEYVFVYLSVIDCLFFGIIYSIKVLLIHTQNNVTWISIRVTVWFHASPGRIRINIKQFLIDKIKIQAIALCCLVYCLNDCLTGGGLVRGINWKQELAGFAFSVSRIILEAILTLSRVFFAC